MMNSMIKTMNDNEVLCNRVIDLEDDVEEEENILDLSKVGVPIPIIEKERKGKSGRPRCLLYIQIDYGNASEWHTTIVH